MVCHNCGAESKDTATFCTNCGSRIIPQPQVQVTEYPQYIAAAPKSIGTGSTVAIVAGSIGFFILLFGFIGYLIIRSLNYGIFDPEQFFRDPDSSAIQRLPGILATPAPIPPAPPPVSPHSPFEPGPGLQPDHFYEPVIIEDSGLTGNWIFESGDWIWFFGQSDLIIFFDYFANESIFGIYANEPDELAFGFFTEDGSLIVEAENGYYKFTWRIDGDRLSLIDSDNDTLRLIRYYE